MAFFRVAHRVGTIFTVKVFLDGYADGTYIGDDIYSAFVTITPAITVDPETFPHLFTAEFGEWRNDVSTPRTTVLFGQEPNSRLSPEEVHDLLKAAAQKLVNELDAVDAGTYLEDDSFS